MKAFHIVYVTTNLINFKYYIGVHSTDDLDDGYMGSGKTLLKAVKKYGKKNFNRTILHMCSSREEAEELEKYYVNLELLESLEAYNIRLGGVAGWGLPGQANGASKSKMPEEKRREKGRKSLNSRITNGKLKRGDEHNFSKVFLGVEKLKNKAAKGLKTRTENGSQERSIRVAREVQKNAAPKFLLVSPQGHEYVLHYNIQPMCKQLGLAHNIIRSRIVSKNFGCITRSIYAPHKASPIAVATYGWSIYPLEVPNEN